MNALLQDPICPTSSTASRSLWGMSALPVTVPRPTVLQPEVRTPDKGQTDSRLIEMWLHGRTEHTVRSYSYHVGRFRAFVAKPLADVTLSDLQAFDDHLAADPHLCDSSRSRVLAAVKALLSWSHKLGLIPVNVGAALRMPAVKDTLAARIVDEATVHKIMALEERPRDLALIQLLYYGALRISEATGIRWEDLSAAGDTGIVTVLGKGSKTRSVRLPAKAWHALQQLRGDTGPTDPVFVSRKHCALSVAQAARIVKAAAIRAGAPPSFSPHWLRHAHASHALDRGAPVHLVSQTLGHASLATTSRYTHARPGESSGSFLA